MKNWIRFFEIPSLDFARAVRFYSDIFGIQLEACDYGTARMAFFPADEGGCYGAVIACEGFESSANGVIVSFVAEKGIESILEQVERLGGQVIVPKCAVGEDGKGFYALFRDTEGNRIGLHSDQ